MSPNTRRITQIVLSSIVVLTSAMQIWTSLPRATTAYEPGDGSATTVYDSGGGQLEVHCPGANVACFDMNVAKESVNKLGWKEPSSKPCTAVPPFPRLRLASIVGLVGLLAALGLLALAISWPRTPRSDPRS